MKKTLAKKVYYFVDESGDSVFFDKNGKDLVKIGKVSNVFILGYMECDNPNSIHKSLDNIRKEIHNDQYLSAVPSLKKTLKHFHAKDDCPEVKEKIFKSIKNMDIKCFIIVARKNPEYFKSKFNCKKVDFYSYFVEKLFQDRLHLYSEIDIYFSKMGNVLREENMKRALENAKNKFQEKWNVSNPNKIRIFIQEPSQITPLQVIDYILWTVNRAYEKGEMRYFNYIKEKIIFILDIFDSQKYPKNYYGKRNEFDIKKISPLNS